MATGETLYVFTPQAKAQGTATIDTINGNPVLDFDSATDETAIFLGVLPRNYAGGGITALIVWTSGLTTGDVVWDLQVERQNEGTDMSSDSFAAAQSVTDSTNGTAEYANYCTISFTNGAQMDSLGVGESFRLKLTRDADNGSDTLAGDASLRRIEIKET